MSENSDPARHVIDLKLDTRGFRLEHATRYLPFALAAAYILLASAGPTIAFAVAAGVWLFFYKTARKPAPYRYAVLTETGIWLKVGPDAEEPGKRLLGWEDVWEVRLEGDLLSDEHIVFDLRSDPDSGEKRGSTSVSLPAVALDDPVFHQMLGRHVPSRANIRPNVSARAKSRAQSTAWVLWGRLGLGMLLLLIGGAPLLFGCLGLPPLLLVAPMLTCRFPTFFDRGRLSGALVVTGSYLLLTFVFVAFLLGENIILMPEFMAGLTSLLLAHALALAVLVHGSRNRVPAWGHVALAAVMVCGGFLVGTSLYNALPQADLGEASTPSCVAWTPSGEYFVLRAASEDPDKPCTAWRWYTADLKSRLTFQTPPSTLLAVNDSAALLLAKGKPTGHLIWAPREGGDPRQLDEVYFQRNRCRIDKRWALLTVKHDPERNLAIDMETGSVRAMTSEQAAELAATMQSTRPRNSSPRKLRHVDTLRAGVNEPSTGRGRMMTSKPHSSLTVQWRPDGNGFLYTCPPPLTWRTLLSSARKRPVGLRTYYVDVLAAFPPAPPQLPEGAGNGRMEGLADPKRSEEE